MEPNIRAPNRLSKHRLKGERDSNTIVVRNSISLSDMDRTTAQFNKERGHELMSSNYTKQT